MYTGRKVLPLSLLPPGSRGRIVSVDAGHGLRRRLLSMGFMPGQEIRVLQVVGGVVLVRLGSSSTTVALCRGMAQKILVEVF